MKYILTLCTAILLGAFTVPVLAVTPESSTSCLAPLTRSIVKTTRITVAERNLISAVMQKEGITVSTNILSAIPALQKKYGLEVTGTVGPKTRNKINELAQKMCDVNTTVSTPTGATPTVTSFAAYTEPASLELSAPIPGSVVDQGVGKTLNVIWLSKHMKASDDIVIDLIGENYETVIKTWKVKNTGKYEVESNDLDGLLNGYFNLRIRYFCNSDTIACAEAVTTSPFIIYPKTGFIPSVLTFATQLSGKVFYVNESSSVAVPWYKYDKDMTYYSSYLGNVALGKEVLMESGPSSSASIKVKDVKALKKDMTKSEAEIRNAYYVRVKAIKRGNGVNDPEIVLKEATTAQFGIR